MKRIFVASSTLVLIVGGLFAAKAAKKFAAPTSIYYKSGSSNVVGIASISGTDNLLTTATTSGHVAYLRPGTTGAAKTLCTQNGTLLYTKF